MNHCQFVGDANTVNGRVIPCAAEAVALMRLRGVDQIAFGYKPRVCREHMVLMLSERVRAAGREWLIDRFLSEHRTGEKP